MARLMAGDTGEDENAMMVSDDKDEDPEEKRDWVYLNQIRLAPSQVMEHQITDYARGMTNEPKCKIIKNCLLTDCKLGEESYFAEVQTSELARSLGQLYGKKRDGQNIVKNQRSEISTLKTN